MSPAVVQPASPVSRPRGNRRRQSSSTAGPPARWMAPSTPAPPRIARFAALTTASTSCWVMSPSTTVILTRGLSLVLPQELERRPLERGLALVGVLVAPAGGGLDGLPPLVGVDDPRVDVRRPREGGRVAEERRHLLH